MAEALLGFRLGAPALEHTVAHRVEALGRRLVVVSPTPAVRLPSEVADSAFDSDAVSRRVAR